MLKEQLENILEEVLKKDPSLFLLELTVSPSQQIRIVLDGDRGVSLKDCMEVSREVENRFNRDEMDYSLEVTSAGATSPLVMQRQYTKNIGRKLAVKAGDAKIEGKLTAVNGDHITLEWKEREDKPVGKGKITVQKKQQIALSDIEEAKVVLKF